MSIAYTYEDVPPAGEVAGVFRRSGIRRPHGDLGRIEKMVAHANLIVCARDEGGQS